MKETDWKLNKSYRSDSNQELDNLNMKSIGKAMNTKTLAGSMQKILIWNLKLIIGFMGNSHTPLKSESQPNPYKQDLREKKLSHEFVNKD